MCKILIMGLPGSGKTTLAKALSKEINAPHINADEIRSVYKDWDFSIEGRIRQAQRISMFADNTLTQTKNVICDFVCPTEKTRETFGEALIIWMDTIKSSRYKDTDLIFEIPKADIRITNLNTKEAIDLIKEKL